LDFLYADHERVASFLAQLEGEGAPKEMEKSATKSKKSNSEGKINVGVLEGGIGSERDWGQEVRLTYDPLWSNSRKLLDHVEDLSNGRSSESLAIGQLRVLSGTLLAYDLSSLTNLMNSDAMEESIAGGIQDDEASANRSPSARKAEKKKKAQIIREFLKNLPLGIGFVLVSDEGHFWFSVKREYLSLYELDVPLKFPIHISGVWSVLGVVDALSDDHVSGIQSVMDRNIDGLVPAVVVHMMQLIGATAALFGRPLQAHGLSPLIVYRRVTS
jgi:hypothetical protein